MSSHNFAPGKRPPPLEDRPRCAYCGAPLLPHVVGGHVVDHDTGARAPKEWTGFYKSYGPFCGLRCAAQFAKAAYAAGYRRDVI